MLSLETRFNFCMYIDRCVLGSNKLANYTKKSKLKFLKWTSCTSDPFNIGLSLRNYPFNIIYQYNWYIYLAKIRFISWKKISWLIILCCIVCMMRCENTNMQDKVLTCVWSRVKPRIHRICPDLDPDNGVSEWRDGLCS